MHKIRLAKLSDCMIFFDFDNTITSFDILDDIIERFSVNTEWIEFENAWKRGEIGSRVCLEGQLKSVRLTKRDLLLYLSRIRIDPHFYRFYTLLRREGIQPVILSDNFTFIIDTMLYNNGIRGIRVHANKLAFREGRLIPSFPYSNRLCLRCAHCKKKSLLKRDISNKIILYIGDGLSDVCPAEYSDIVFAKDDLLSHLRKTKRMCLAFDNLEDINYYFRGLER